MADPAQLRVGDDTYSIFRLPERAGRLPYTLRILLEQAAERGAQRGYNRVVADHARGTGLASTALKSRGVNLSGSIPRRA